MAVYQFRTGRPFEILYSKSFCHQLYLRRLIKIAVNEIHL